jgi:hypothetical protein
MADERGGYCTGCFNKNDVVVDIDEFEAVTGDLNITMLRINSSYCALEGFLFVKAVYQYIDS